MFRDVVIELGSWDANPMFYLRNFAPVKHGTAESVMGHKELGSAGAIAQGNGM